VWTSCDRSPIALEQATWPRRGQGGLLTVTCSSRTTLFVNKPVGRRTM
jgi:hypothetical protein